MSGPVASERLTLAPAPTDAGSPPRIEINPTLWRAFMSTSLPTRPASRQSARPSRDSASDEILRDQIAAHLRDRGLAALQITVNQGTVTVTGRAASPYEKQAALQTVRRIAGVERIADQIRIVAASPQKQSAASRATDVGVGLWEAFAAWFGDTPKSAWVVILAAVLIPTTMFSCGGPVDAKVEVHKAAGKVSFNGAAPSGAIVTLNPTGAFEVKNAVPKGVVKDDGTFHLSVYEDGDGAPAGDYVVTVQWFKLVSGDGGSGAGPNVIPAQYTNPATSPIKVTIKEGANDLPPIEISGR